MVSDEALKKLQEQIEAWPMTQRFVVHQLIEDYRRNREDLRAYKATGLTTERCAEFARADAEGRYIVMRDAKQEGVARLRELAEADKDGRVVVLPCKVGDTVYRVFCGNMKNPVISEFKISNVHDAVTLIGKMGMHKYTGVFRTREEAEAALEAMKDE